MNSNQTIDYYEKNADSFAAGTISVDFTEIQDRFLSFLPADGFILDFGCGSGRDTKYFLEKGFNVEAVDGSEALCKIASENTGITVKHMLFQELDAVEKYDGIWACASILHLPKESLKDVFKKMICATKNDGYIYVSFKYGEFEGLRGDRYFTDFTESKFIDFLSSFPVLSLVDQRITCDVRPNRENEKWLNLILKKSNTI